MKTNDRLTAVATIKSAVAECVEEARKYGRTGTAYEPTAADCDWISGEVVKAISRKATKAEWQEAGFEYVGNAHYGESEESDDAADLAEKILEASDDEEGMVEAADARRIAGNARPDCHQRTSAKDLAARLGCADELARLLAKR
jgi:hypothetical protein